MDIEARRLQEKEKMRQKILLAATDIIVREGYDKLSMRKLASEIDYSPTTIYIYYRDKSQIVFDISLQLYALVVADIKETLAEHASQPIDIQLKKVLQAFVNGIAKHPEMGKAVLRSGTKAMFGPARDSLAPEDSESYILKNILAQGQQQGVFRTLHPDIYWMMNTSLLGFSMFAVETQQYLSPLWENMLDTFTDYLIRGILPD